MTKTILIVEDDASLMRVLTEKLILAGFHVLQAKDGEEGFRTAQEKHPDLILLDIIMPGTDGMGMLRSLRYKFPTNDTWGKTVPVILLTNVDTPETMSEALKKGVLYLVKSDVTLDQVVEAVKEKLSIPLIPQSHIVE